MTRPSLFHALAAIVAFPLTIASGCSSTPATGSPSDAGGDVTVGCKSTADCTGKLPQTVPPNCATASCDSLSGACVFAARDEDGDGHAAARCASTNGVPIQTGDDCDDHNALLYPGHPESCAVTADGGTPAGVLCVQGTISCLASGLPSPCTGTKACPNGCVSGNCTECTPGQSQCSPVAGNQTGVETCTSAGTWGAPVSCGNAATCVVSGDAASCQGNCAKGATMCGGANGVQTCSLDGVWGAPVACSNQTCEDGACQGSCAPMQTECSGNGVATCSNGGWGASSPCSDQTCVGTNAGADSGASGLVSASCQGVCAEGAAGCNGQQPQTCDGTGQWQPNGAACTESQTCVNGTCQGVCGPSQLTCNGQQPEICSPLGQWQESGSVCSASQTCASGVCTGMCGPATLNCSGNQPQTCDATGTWQNSGPPCAGAAPVCNAGTCVLCAPNSLGCAGQQPQQCTLSGESWQDIGAACGVSQTCVGGACTGICGPGQTNCNGQQPQVCGSNGQWTNAAACVKQACVGGTCSGVCTPNSEQCSGNGVETCNSSGAWGAPAACPSDRTCVSGACSGVCGPGQVQCGNTQPQVCGPAGSWQSNGAACVAPSTCGINTGACCTPSSRYTVLSVGTGPLTGRVRDNTTGLTWTQVQGTGDFATAQSTCPGLGAGWTLPTEAQALAISGSADDTCAFPEYWDTWVIQSAPANYAYWVTFAGSDVQDEAAATTYFLCVQ